MTSTGQNAQEYWHGFCVNLAIMNISSQSAQVRKEGRYKLVISCAFKKCVQLVTWAQEIAQSGKKMWFEAYKQYSETSNNEKITHTLAIVNSMYPSILKVSMRMGSSSITLWYKSVYFVRSYEKNKARWKKWLNNVEVEIRFQHVIPHNTCNVWKRELLQTLKKMMIKMSASLKELDIRKVRALQVWNTLGGLS